MDYCSNFEHDLALGQLKEKELGKIFDNAKIEVKHDKRALETGNVFIEYESRGKKSGIQTSKADYYCIAFGEGFHLISKKELFKRCVPFFKSGTVARGGDNDTSMGVLLPVTELLY